MNLCECSVIAVLLTMTSCGGGSRERLSPEECFDGIEVPKVGTVGDFSDANSRHVVNVTSDGRIVLGGQDFDFEALRAELVRRAARSSRPSGVKPGQLGPDSVSAESVVLRVDGALPWGATVALLFECQRARIPEVMFAVRHERDGSEGAFSFVLPMCAEVLSGRWASVRIRAEPGSVTPTVLYWHIVRGRPTWMRTPAAPFDDAGRLRVEVDADVRLPTRTVVEYFDAMLRAGATVGDVKIGNLDFELFDESAVWFRRAISASWVLSGPVDVRLEDVRGAGAISASPESEPIPPEPRVSGRSSGLLEIKEMGSTNLGANWSAPSPR